MSFEHDAATNGKTGLDSNDGTNDVLDDPAYTLDMVHLRDMEIPEYLLWRVRQQHMKLLCTSRNLVLLVVLNLKSKYNFENKS